MVLGSRNAVKKVVGAGLTGVTLGTLLTPQAAVAADYRAENLRCVEIPATVPGAPSAAELAAAQHAAQRAAAAQQQAQAESAAAEQATTTTTAAAAAAAQHHAAAENTAAAQHAAAVAQLQQTLQEITTQEAAARQRHSAAELGLRDNETELQNILAQLDTASAAATSAEAEAAAAAAAVTAATEPADLVQPGNQQPSVAQLEQRIAEMQQELAALREALQRLTAAAQQQEQELQRLTTEQTVKTQRVTELTAALAAATQELEPLQTAAAAAETALQQAEQELAAAAQAVDVNNPSYQQRQEALTAAREAQQQATTQVAELNQRIAELTTELEQQNADLAALEQRRLGLLTDNAQLQTQLQEINEQLVQNERESAAKAAELATAQERLAEATANLEAAETANQPEFTPAQLESGIEIPEAAVLYRVVDGSAVRVTQLREVPANTDDMFLQTVLPNGEKFAVRVTGVTPPQQAGGEYTVTGAVPAAFGTGKQLRATVATEKPSERGVYYSFRELVEAMQQDSQRDVRLGRDLYADEMPTPSGGSYVTGEFGGTLEGQGFKIHGLVKPLFETLSGAHVTNLQLVDTKIHSTADTTGALAMRSVAGSYISQVHVEGDITAVRSVGAIVSYAERSEIDEVSMVGNIRSQYTGGEAHIGGLVGMLSGGTLRKGGFHGTITTQHGDNARNRVGGAAGYVVNGGFVNKVYVGGTLNNTTGYGQVGGVVGSTWADNQNHGRVEGALTAMRVIGGQLRFGDTGFRANLRGIAHLEGEASGKADPHRYGGVLQRELLAYYLNDYLAIPRDVRAIWAAQHPQAPADTATRAEQNYRLLLPYADAATITAAAARLGEQDALNTKVLRAVVATRNGAVVSNPGNPGQEIDGLLLHYADGTVETRAVIADPRSPEPGAGLVHFYMAGQLPYTPAQQLTAADTDTVLVAAELAERLAAVSFDSLDMSQLYSRTAWEEMVTSRYTHAVAEARRKNETEPTREQVIADLQREQRGLLYLRQSFEKQRPALRSQLEQLLDNSGHGHKTAQNLRLLQQQIEANQTAVLLGLAYVNKWYDISFGQRKLRDMLLFNNDFYADQRSPLEVLLQLGSNYGMLDPRNNLGTYQALFAKQTGHDDLAQLLDQLRQQFTTSATFDDWFRAATQAYIVEVPSVDNPTANVSAADRFTKSNRYRSALLPILTVSPDTVFVIVHMTTVSLGTFERYYDVRTMTPQQLPAKIAELKQRVLSYAQRYRDYYDMWYRIGNETMRSNLINDIPTWDGYSYALRWTDRFGPGNFQSVEQFFGPIGRWFSANGTAGYSNGDATFMVVDGMLGSIVTYTHEMVHNLERRVYLGGHGVRRHSRPELYPTSFLQNPDHRHHDAWGFNQSDYYSTGGGSYLHNSHPNRFQNVADLEQYFKGYFEALYLLDHAEAEALLERDAADKAKIFMKLNSHPVNNNRHLNSYDALTTADIEGMTLNSISDLVTNSLMMRRRMGPSNGIFHANGYWSVPILDPLYGTGESDLGLSGENVFRRNAFELLAARGFHVGFAGYTSNKYQAEAQQAGLPELPDTFVMQKIFEGTPYRSLQEYRIAAYQEAKTRAADRLRPIHMNFNGETFTMNNFGDMVDRFRGHIAHDFREGVQNDTNRSRTYKFKEALFSELMRNTAEFRSSVYTDGVTLESTPPAETPIVAPPRQTVAQPVANISTAQFATATLPQQYTPEQLQQLRELREGYAAQVAALTAAQQRLAQTETALRNALQTAAALLQQNQLELAGLPEARAELENAVNTLTVSLTAKREQVAAQQQALAAAAQREQDILAELGAAAVRLVTARQKVAAAQQTRTAAVAATQPLQERIAALAAQRETAVAAAAEAATQQQVAAQSLAGAQQQLATTVAEVAASREDLAHLTHLQSLTAALLQQQQQLQTRQQQVAALVVRREQQQQRITAARAELQQATTAQQRLAAAKAELAGAEVAQLLPRRAELAAHLALAQQLERLAAAEREVAQTQQRLAELQQLAAAAEQAKRIYCVYAENLYAEELPELQLPEAGAGQVDQQPGAGNGQAPGGAPGADTAGLPGSAAAAGVGAAGAGAAGAAADAGAKAGFAESVAGAPGAATQLAATGSGEPWLLGIAALGITVTGAAAVARGRRRTP